MSHTLAFVCISTERLTEEYAVLEHGADRHTTLFGHYLRIRIVAKLYYPIFRNAFDSAQDVQMSHESTFATFELDSWAEELATLRLDLLRLAMGSNQLSDTECTIITKGINRTIKALICQACALADGVVEALSTLTGTQLAD